MTLADLWRAAADLDDTQDRNDGPPGFFMDVTHFTDPEYVAALEEEIERGGWR